MILFALTEGEVSKGWLIDFVDAWGNAASVAGLLVAIIAFPVTWHRQRMIREASQAAVRKVAQVILAFALDDLNRLLSTALNLAEEGQWLRALDWFRNAKYGVHRTAENIHIPDEEKKVLRAGADDLTQVIEYIERYKRGEGASREFKKDKKRSVDGLLITLTKIRARLDERIGEV